MRADAPPDHVGFAGPELLAVLPSCPPVFRPRHLPDAARPTHELYPQACPKSATPLQIIYELREDCELRWSEIFREFGAGVG